ncbi:MAG: cytochrome C [bacterium]|nr:cytochrome C [bacterium]
MLFLMLACATPSRAIDWERMLLPGLLVAGHEEFEKDCTSCHQAFEGDAQRSLCLACHDLVADDLRLNEGFHGRDTLASVGQCRSCHSDHLGRDADIRGLSEATFDHSQTDYVLAGRHESTACAECHLAGIEKRDTPADCIACHKEDDAHKGALKEDCGECHHEEAWRGGVFDHDETEYPLTGSHQTASCKGCHVADQYQKTPKNCLSCHAIDDVHVGKFGPDCVDCHDTESWRQKGFDHKKKSGFALTGAHEKSSCVSCHRQPPGERELPENCSGCHSNDDFHAGRFDAACDACHSPKSWSRVEFDHLEKTEFPLSGAHDRASCEACHTDRVSDEKKIATDCHSCHMRDDVHEKSLGKDCAGCHTEESFSAGIRFDHELTGFPLLGLHAIASCESCHPDQAFHETEIACRSCHEAEDVHKEGVGSGCGRCHNPNGWAIWRFDHDVETKFRLDGKHAGLECEACHRSPMSERTSLSADCNSCHASEDPHRGGFGRECRDCHGSDAWKPASFGRGRGPKK